jgi:hypothetical protein
MTDATKPGLAATDKAIFVIDDNGDTWQLNETDWKKTKVTDAQSLFVLNQLQGLGTYLAFPQTFSAGIGGYCTIVNLKAILNNQRAQGFGHGANRNPAPPGPPSPLAATASDLAGGVNKTPYRGDRGGGDK